MGAPPMDTADSLYDRYHCRINWARSPKTASRTTSTGVGEAENDDEAAEERAARSAAMRALKCFVSSAHASAGESATEEDEGAGSDRGASPPSPALRRLRAIAANTVSPPNAPTHRADAAVNSSSRSDRMAAGVLALLLGAAIVGVEFGSAAESNPAIRERRSLVPRVSLLACLQCHSTTTLLQRSVDAGAALLRLMATRIRSEQPLCFNSQQQNQPTWIV